MGAWGVGPFDNDAALDWTHELGSEGSRFLIATLARVADADADAYLDADDCSEALAAVATLVASRGGEVRVPDAVADWLRRSPALPGDLDAMARDVVRRVLDGSELAELWQDEGDLGWRVATAGLISKLG